MKTSKEYEDYQKKRDVFLHCIHSTIELQNKELDENFIRKLSKEYCEDAGLSFDRLNRCILTPLIINNPCLKEGFLTVMEGMPDIMNKMDAMCCNIPSDEGFARCKKIIDPVQKSYEEYHKARHDDAVNGFFREPYSLAVALIPVALAVLLLCTSFMNVWISRTWVPVLSILGVISVLIGFFKGSWGAFKFYIGFILLFYIILQIIRAVFGIDNSVDLITPFFKYVFAAILLLIALIILLTHLGAAQTRKSVSQKRKAFEERFRDFFVEAAFVLNRVEGILGDFDNPLLPYSFYLENLFEHFYEEEVLVPLMTETQVIETLRRL